MEGGCPVGPSRPVAPHRAGRTRGSSPDEAAAARGQADREQGERGGFGDGRHVGQVGAQADFVNALDGRSHAECGLDGIDKVMKVVLRLEVRRLQPVVLSNRYLVKSVTTVKTR